MDIARLLRAGLICATAGSLFHLSGVAGALLFVAGVIDTWLAVKGR